MLPYRGYQLLDEEDQQDAANRRKIEIVYQERIVQFEGGPVSHQFSSRENDDVVSDKERHC